MKILRLFDSLKFVRVMFVAVATAFILNVAHADTTAIQSVIAYGKTEQNGTPTPTNPVPIMTNNGELKAGRGKNLFNPATVTKGGYIGNDGNFKEGSAYCHSDYIKVSSGKTYTKSNIGADSVAFYDLSKKFIRRANATSFTATSDGYVILNCRTYDQNRQFEEGATATAYEPYREGDIYTNGLTETIRDAAGLKATAEMLLSVGDYKDEQNITTGAITRRVGVKVLDGTESWDRVFVYGNVKNVVIAPLSSIAPDAKILKNKIRCSHFRTYDGGAFTGSTAGIDWASNYYNSTPSVGIQVPGITTSVAQFKAWLAEQYAAGTPVIVLYPLATETTENVATQTLTTAPVRQTLGAIMNMPIKTILTDNTEIMSGANELIKIATTKYNEESFEDVQDALTGVFNAVDTVVTQTMSQAQVIDQIATSKQTRPDEGCTAKYCLLVEDENGAPHWYPIVGANGSLGMPDGYVEFDWVETDGNVRVQTDVVFDPTKTVTVTATAQSSVSSASETRILYGFGSNAGTWTGATNVWTSGPGAVSDVVATTKVDLKTEWNDGYEYFYVNDNYVGRRSISVDMPANSTLSILKAGAGSVYFIGKLYGLKLLVDGDVKMQLVPVQRVIDNVVGLYDVVNGAFYTVNGGNVGND